MSAYEPTSSCGPCDIGLVKMEPHYHELDPDGDLVLVFPDCAKAELQHIASASVRQQSSSDTVMTGESGDKADGVGESNDDDKGDDGKADDGDKVGEDDKAATVRIRVSSKHMTLASCVFRAMLQPSFKEGLALQASNVAQVVLPADPPAAFLIILSAIHGRLRAAPPLDAPRILAQIAVLADKYQLHEALEVYKSMWIDRLKPAMATVSSESLCDWLCVAWVFRRKEEFTLLTQIAQRVSTEKLGENVSKYPILDAVVRAVLATREKAISNVVSALNRLVKKYKYGETNCPTGGVDGFHCDALILGALEKRLDSIISAQSPFEGHSFAS